MHKSLLLYLSKFVIKTLLLLIVRGLCVVNAQSFVHPGGIHTLTDLERMKMQVTTGAHPWIEGWNKLIADPDAQNTYTPTPQANMGVSRQRASRDAHAAYLNTIRWYISGDTSYADCAVNICNAWSSTVNQIPTGTDIPGLSGIPIFEFAMVGELLQICSRWDISDFNRFKSMMMTYWYPVCHDFLVNHNGACISHYWANWDACNIGAILTIGVLCDDRVKFNEAIEYYKKGTGMGSIKNAVYYFHPGNLGQWQESGRDQEHAQLGVGLLGAVCQVAWNQGIDLFGYDNNRLLAGAEYVAQYNLWKDVPYKFYNNCQPSNNKWPAINGRGRLDDRPVWELLYNHYVVRQGLSAPNTQLMAELMRPEHGSKDHFGYGTLTFTLKPSDYPPLPIPSTPTGLVAKPGVSRVFLKWNPIERNIAQGYRIQRSTDRKDPFNTIESWTENTATQYIDVNVTNGITYYYVVAANNQAGTSENSFSVSVTPQAAGSLPSGWIREEVGQGTAGNASYASIHGETFLVSGYGSSLGSKADTLCYVYKNITGDATITGRISQVSGRLLKTGLMARESLSTDSKSITLTLGDAGWRFARMGIRSTTGGEMKFEIGNAYTWLPAWFRIQRSCNIFTTYESPDGSSWFKVGSVNVNMNNQYYIGLVVCSGKQTSVCNTTFDNVSVFSGLPE